MSRPGGGYQGGGAHASYSQAGAVHGPYGGGFEGGRQGAAAVGPRGGNAEGGRAGGVYTGPGGAVAIGGGRAGSVTGPGGNSISGGRAGGVVIGPNGNVHAGGVQGGSVVTPGGVAAGGRAGGFTSGPNGVVAGGGRGGFAAGPGGVVAGGSRAGFAAGPGGYVAGGSRAGFAAGPGGYVGGAGRGAAAFGPYGAAAIGGRSFAGYGGGYGGTRYVSGAALRTQGGYIRNGFGYSNAFSPGWYGRYPGAWLAAGWGLGMAWNSLPWGGYSSYLGYGAGTPPVYFDYGNNVTYQNDQVFYGDQPVASAADYAQQAAQIAAAGQQPPADPAADPSWQPLGVFAMAQGDETTSNDIFQLALNPAGLVRGNYYNAFTDTNNPLSGSLDKTSQRIAWTIGDRANPVYETGLYNLTQEQTTLLVHFGADRTEQFKLFRIPQPGDPGAAPPPNN